MDKKHLMPILVLTTTCIFWGLSWMPLRFFSGLGIDGLALIFVTHTVLACLFLPYLIVQKGSPLNVKYLLGIAVAGGMGIFSFTYALIHGDVVRVMVLFYLLPIWGVIGGRVFLKERVSRRRWLCVLIALPGAFLILGGLGVFSTPPSWIDLLALVSGVSFAVNNILFRGVGQLKLSMKLFAMFVGCALITGGLMVFGLEGFPKSVENSSWFYLLFYTVTGVLLANVGSQWAVERMEAGRSSIIIIVQLVAAVISATLIGGERLDSWEWLGCTMVILATIIETRSSERMST